MLIRIAWIFATGICEMAKERGVKIVINTDSHHTSHLDKIKYGVLQARRALVD